MDTSFETNLIINTDDSYSLEQMLKSQPVRGEDVCGHGNVHSKTTIQPQGRADSMYGDYLDKDAWDIGVNRDQWTAPDEVHHQTEHENATEVTVEDVNTQSHAAVDNPSTTPVPNDYFEHPMNLQRTKSIHPVRIDGENTSYPLGEEHSVKVERFLNESNRHYPVISIQKNENSDLRKVFTLHFQEYDRVVGHVTDILQDEKDVKDWEICLQLTGSEQRQKFNMIKITTIDTFDGCVGKCEPRKIDLRYWFLQKDSTKNDWIPTRAGVRLSKDDARSLVELKNTLKLRTNTLINDNYRVELAGEILATDFKERTPKKDNKSRRSVFKRYLGDMTLPRLRKILETKYKKTNGHNRLINRKLNVNDIFRYLKSSEGLVELVKYID